jgi:hypothetical protein
MATFCSINVKYKCIDNKYETKIHTVSLRFNYTVMQSRMQDIDTVLDNIKVHKNSYHSLPIEVIRK